jgi:hypothetical protein
MFKYISHVWQTADKFGKRGWIYSILSTIGLGYTLLLDRPVKWFAVIVWALILGLGVSLIRYKKSGN